MAKIKEITVNYGITKSIARYEFLRLDTTIKATIDDLDDVSEVYQQLVTEAKDKTLKTAEIELELLRNW